MKREASSGKQTRTKKFILTEKITGVSDKNTLYSMLEKKVYEYNSSVSDGGIIKTLNLPQANESTALFWAVNEEGNVTCGLKIKQTPIDKKTSSSDPSWGFLLDLTDGKWKAASSIRSCLQDGNRDGFSIDGEDAKLISKSLINVCSSTKHPELISIVSKFV